MPIAQRKLTVVGAGYVGMTCAQLTAAKDLASEVVVIDVNEGRAKGIALYLDQMAAIEGSARAWWARPTRRPRPARTW